MKRYLCLLLIALFLIVGCTKQDIKMSTSISHAIDLADIIVSQSSEADYKLDKTLLESLDTAIQGFNDLGEIYIKESNDVTAGPFKDMSMALIALKTYLTTKDQKAYNEFVSLYGPAKAILVKYIEELQVRGL